MQLVSFKRKNEKSFFFYRLRRLLPVFFLVQFWSHGISKIDFRGIPNAKLVIELSKASPSWAAYEDSQEEGYKNSEKKINENSSSLGLKIDNAEIQKSERLSSGGKSSSWEKLSLKLELNRESDRGGDRFIQAESSHTVYSRLKGMKLARQEEPVLSKNSNITLQSMDSSSIIDQLRKEFWADNNQIDGKSVIQDSDLSLSQKANQLVTEELKRREKDKNERVLSSSTGGKILVAKSLSSSPQLFLSSQEQPTGPREKVVQPSISGISIEPVSSSNSRLHSFLLSGKFQIQGGLVYDPSHMRFELFHQLYDQILATGEIWESEAQFKIKVKELKGELIFRLITTGGKIVGGGSLALHQLNPPSPNRQNQINNLVASLAPLPSGAVFQVISAYSIGTPGQIPVSEARADILGLNRFYKTDAKGHIDDPDFLPNSNFLVRVQKKEYWGTLAISQSDANQSVLLFPQRMIDNLLGIVGKNNFHRNELREKAIIWGQVVRNGNGVAGAKLELAGEEELEPIFFNQAYLPDPHLTATSENGLFVFVGVNSGIQSIRVHMGGIAYPAKTILTESKFVSPLQLDMGDPVSSLIKITVDPLRQKEASAIFKVAGSETEYKVDGESVIQWQEGRDLSLIEADAGTGKEVVRLTLDRYQGGMAVPMISSDWLLQMAIQKRINLEGEKGVVVGYVNNKDYEVFIDEREPYLAENVVYFDQKGEIVRGNDGKAGGGFILFNVPSGFHSVIVVSKGSDQILSRLVVTEPAVTNVIPDISL